MSKSKRWKPKIKDEFWFLSFILDVGRSNWYATDLDKDMYRLGNCFQTKEEADTVARKLKGFWKDVREGR